MSGPIFSQQFVDFAPTTRLSVVCLRGFLEFVSKGGGGRYDRKETCGGLSQINGGGREGASELTGGKGIRVKMIGTASTSAVASSSAAAAVSGGGGLDDINLYDISAEDMLDIWGDHHMDTAAAEAEVGIHWHCVT